jgi:hypothetical protein
MSVFTNPSGGAVRQATGYVEAVLELLGNHDPLVVLRETPEFLRKAMIGLSLEQLGRPEAPGKWSIRSVVRHLSDTEIVWGYRVRMTLGSDRPTLGGFDQDRWAQSLRYSSSDEQESLRVFEVLRGAHVALVGHLTEPEKQRTAVHSERGEETVAHMIRLYAGHDLVHRRQIERTRRSLGAS